jgi:hypothetical protein
MREKLAGKWLLQDDFLVFKIHVFKEHNAMELTVEEDSEEDAMVVLATSAKEIDEIIAIMQSAREKFLESEPEIVEGEELEEITEEGEGEEEEAEEEEEEEGEEEAGKD